jgi:hypothetical protein
MGSELVNDESFKYRALSAGAVTAFDGQTEIHSLPSISQIDIRR